MGLGFDFGSAYAKAQLGAGQKLPVNGTVFISVLDSVKGADGPQDMDDNDLYLSGGLVNDIEVDGRVVSGSPLANLVHEQFAFTCGDCHLGSAGANNRTGDYRSSGCTACHMPHGSPNPKQLTRRDVRLSRSSRT